MPYPEVLAESCAVAPRSAQMPTDAECAEFGASVGALAGFADTALALRRLKRALSADHPVERRSGLVRRQQPPTGRRVRPGHHRRGRRLVQAALGHFDALFERSRPRHRARRAAARRPVAVPRPRARTAARPAVGVDRPTPRRGRGGHARRPAGRVEPADRYNSLAAFADDACSPTRDRSASRLAVRRSSEWRRRAPWSSPRTRPRG